jgi:2-methylfumaryl-CoA isomerase
MYRLLDDLRIVEGASFIAAPSCGLHLAQMGAEVIRFDAIGGGPDFRRWPRSENGSSLYWEGLNKGKKSVALNLGSAEGRDLAVAIATAPGGGGGLFVTNYPVDGFLSHESLAARRPDLISVRVMGWADGSAALDYTVNSALGLPFMTGPAELEESLPVNHVLPAWDLLTGIYATFAMLAAERRRLRTGSGEEVKVPLADVAMATLGHLGQIAEVTLSGLDRKRTGNDLFGAFGRDFVTKDGRRVMIVALTARQWGDLIRTLQLGEAIGEIERQLGVDFSTDEGVRFQNRDRLNALVASKVVELSDKQLATAFSGTAVCWGPYNKLIEAIGHSNLISEENALFMMMEQPSGRKYLTPGAAASLMSMTREAPGMAPRLGEHTEEVLSHVLGLPSHEIAQLHDRGTVASAKRNKMR